ncbi:glycosyltransferase family 4 protein, partial [Chloroflexota bacterium]
MKILFYADGRSTATRNWLKFWVQRGDEVHLATSFSCEDIPGLTSVQFVPAAFSSAKKAVDAPGKRISRIWGSSLVKTRLLIRQWLGPLTIPAAGEALKEIANRIQPDLVHAMRIPFEGMVAGASRLSYPLVTSVWGSDFIQHARSSPLMGYWTRKAMQAADGLHPDCERDLRLGREWGFDKDKPNLVIPGNGGIDPKIFHQPDVPVTQPVVLNPRGFRSSIRQDVFFQSIPLVLDKVKNARFLCSSMAGDPDAEAWVKRLGIGSSVYLLPHRPHAEMGDLLRETAVLVSPSSHDGTPNSVLEGMACGCYPVAGDIESLREWIISGKNGTLVDAGNAEDLAAAISTALLNQEMRLQAAKKNAIIIASRADYMTSMGKA